MIFDSGKGNIRNRVMHGIFMLTGKRLQDNLIASGLATRPTPLERDAHTSENIANLVLECLQYLDNKVVRGSQPLPKPTSTGGLPLGCPPSSFRPAKPTPRT